jgi:hypothetical protein
MKRFLFPMFVACGFGTHALAADAPGAFSIPANVKQVLSTYCESCHAEKGKGGVDLTRIESLTLEARLDLLNKVQDQLFFRLMPPAKSDQPEAGEAAALADWLRAELRRHKASKLDAKMPYPDAGNYIDHAVLFGGTIKDKAFTPARRWLVSPQIFEERVLDVFQLDARERENFKRQGFFGVTNPFVLPEHSGVRDYDTAALDGGHLLVMLTNAEWISNKQIRAARVKKGELKADQFDNPKDKWYPKATPEAFERIILKATPPTAEELTAAIQAQFGFVLRRPAGEKELQRYLELTRSSIEIGGNTEGLRQMLVSVLLESEFLYRLEFGSGPADASGRRMLSPREASYAISYALGDRGPDPQLVKAAQDGRLNTREDFKREVIRLLNDPQYYHGQVDKTLNGNFQSNSTSHPKVVRFFREFFGYPNALKVFKDSNRLGIYRNPDRGTTGTPGVLTLEADRVVTSVVQADANVFATLLTTDEFFVFHNLDNDKGQKVIADWKQLYEALKDTDWRKNPAKVAEEHAELLKKNKIVANPMGRGVHDNTLTRVMQHFEYTFGKGNTPFTTFPWAHGNYHTYSQLYNLPAPPGLGGKYGGDDALNYPVVQPFKLENRKGILTHPAWLIAHSGNFQTDPIRRGRWIREKLLAGSVPDVPITVDAQVPENPHKTFRERVEGVTAKAECWKCHRQMNPLGYAFEVYDDFGRFRTQESLENIENLVSKANARNTADVYKTKPVNAAGQLTGTGDPQLDGDVDGALDLIDRLAKSERVRQSIIRHAFRFYMGRNEMPSDSQTLIDADTAYVASGGSFKAVILSLLTSDSFIYRK